MVPINWNIGLVEEEESSLCLLVWIVESLAKSSKRQALPLKYIPMSTDHRGSYLREMREIPLGAIEKAAFIYADDYEGMRAEAGEFMTQCNEGNGHLIQLSGTLAELHVNPVERGVEDITIFKSVGAAHFDLAVAKGVFEKAEEMNEGEEILL